MTKKRLKELIKQRATIWYDGHFEIKLNPEQYSITEAFGETVLWYQPKDQPSGYDWSWELDVLREDVDRAKWEHKMHTQRTERFEPPMWEEIKGYYRFNFMNCENGAWKKYSFELLKKQDDKAKEGGYISIWTGTKDIYNKTTPTKENYEKACEIVRDLFKGEK